MYTENIRFRDIEKNSGCHARHTCVSTSRRTQNYAGNHISVRNTDSRSERRIIQNKLRRQRELRNNFLIFAATICLVVIFSFTLNTFRSNAKSESPSSYKYYKSISIAENDTLWSIAERYMDREHYESIPKYIAELKHINSLAGDSIHYGEYLIVPYYDSEYIR